MDGEASAIKRDWQGELEGMMDFGEELMDVGWLDTYDEELERMNRGKRGRPYRITNSAVDWIMRFRAAAKIGYGVATGILNSVLKRAGRGGVMPQSLQEQADALAMSRDIGDSRILATFAGEAEPSGRPIDVAADSTGMSLNKYGGWLIMKYRIGKRSGWIKLHTAIETATNRMLAYSVTAEDCGDPTCFEGLMDAVLGRGHMPARILADAAYDAKRFWNKYGGMGIGVVINIKSPQLGKYLPDGRFEVRSHGCAERAAHIRRIADVGREQWKKEVGYGARWKAECSNSDIKRMFGDMMRARKLTHMPAEIHWKVSAYNDCKECRAKRLGTI